MTTLLSQPKKKPTVMSLVNGCWLWTKKMMGEKEEVGRERNQPNFVFK